MTRRRLTDDDLDRVYLAICHAAAAGEPCPSSAALAKLAGARSPASGQKILDRLVAAGAIRVEPLGRNRRVVTVTASGQATAAPPRAGGKTRRGDDSNRPGADPSRRHGRVDAESTRRSRGQPAAPGALSRAGCQWIEHEPSPDDSCKCLAPVVVDPDGRARPYCAAHLARSIRRDQPKGLRLPTRRLRSRLGVLMGDAP